ncbi:hypothetical protein Purlil1_2503 [Purpureocillium lilacinum]|uniref:BZIP domain-containing protein n=1 Tax=Purpureocillium lilacinum TaxID=33203 RepID=A0ABR0CBP3_PURLI|nr:hypothetical protein Purlil1_2503 [Purpureocillium lilacinum]
MEASVSTARPWRPDGAHGAHGALAAVAGPLSLLDKLNLLLGAAPSPSVAWTSQKGLSREAALRWLLAAVVTTTAAAQDASSAVDGSDAASGETRDGRRLLGIRPDIDDVKLARWFLLARSPALGPWLAWSPSGGGGGLAWKWNVTEDGKTGPSEGQGRRAAVQIICLLRLAQTRKSRGHCYLSWGRASPALISLLSSLLLFSFCLFVFAPSLQSIALQFSSPVFPPPSICTFCGGDWRGTVRGAWVRALWLAREDQSEPRRGGSFVVDQEEGECQRQKSASDRDMRRANRQMACERARHDERIGNGLRGSPSGRSAPPAPPCRSCLVVDLMDPSASMGLLALVDSRRASPNARPRRSGRAPVATRQALRCSLPLRRSFRPPRLVWTWTARL